MGVRVVVPTGKVGDIRAVLDRLAAHPPTVGTKDMVPGNCFLDYHGIKDSEVGFVTLAMKTGFVTDCSKI